MAAQHFVCAALRLMVVDEVGELRRRIADACGVYGHPFRLRGLGQLSAGSEF